MTASERSVTAATPPDLPPPGAPVFPLARRCPFGPPEEYATLRAAGGLVTARLPDGRPVWLATRLAEAKQVYLDVGITTDSTTPGFPTLTPEDDPEAAAARSAGFFIDMDPPEHDVLRRMLIPEFSLRRVTGMRPRIQHLADALVDDMERAGRSADLVTDFGLPLPSLVICELLGVPYADHDFFQSRTRIMAQLPTDPTDPAGQEVLRAGQQAMLEIRSYLDDLARRAERAPGDDLTGRLVTQRVRTGDLSHEALVGMLFLLLVAGHETTANMIPLGTLALLEHPDQLAGLRADPAGWPGAVEELLRYLSIVDWAAGDRMALGDMEIGGRALGAGDGIFVLNASANHDELAFDRPHELDVRRDARQHVAFGYGVHQCLGQNLARAELEIAYRTLFDRLPGLRASRPAEELPVKQGAAVHGLQAMPVTW